MKELLATSSNITLVEVDGRLRARVELILLVSEPRYAVGESGLTKTRVADDVRTLAAPEHLRALSAELLQMALEAEVLEAKYGVPND